MGVDVNWSGVVVKFSGNFHNGWQKMFYRELNFPNMESNFLFEERDITIGVSLLFPFNHLVSKL